MCYTLVNCRDMSTTRHGLRVVETDKIFPGLIGKSVYVKVCKDCNYVTVSSQEFARELTEIAEGICKEFGNLLENANPAEMCWQMHADQFTGIYISGVIDIITLRDYCRMGVKCPMCVRGSGIE